MLKDAHRSRQHVNLDPGDVDPIPTTVRAPAPSPAINRPTLLMWGIVLCSLAVCGLAAWFLAGVRLTGWR